MANKLIDWRQVRAGARGAVEGYLGLDDDRETAREAAGYVAGLRESRNDYRADSAATDQTQKIMLGVLGVALVAAIAMKR